MSDEPRRTTIEMAGHVGPRDTANDEATTWVAAELPGVV